MVHLILAMATLVLLQWGHPIVSYVAFMNVTLTCTYFPFVQRYFLYSVVLLCMFYLRVWVDIYLYIPGCICISCKAPDLAKSSTCIHCIPVNCTLPRVPKVCILDLTVSHYSMVV